MALVVDCQEFVLDKLSEEWTTVDTTKTICTFLPNFQAHWPVPGDKYPIISVTVDPSPVRTFGLPAFHHRTQKNLRIAFWDSKPINKGIAERRIIEIIMDDNINPTTANFPSSGIGLFQVTTIEDNDDYIMSPVVFRRDIMLTVWYQDSY